MTADRLHNNPPGQTEIALGVVEELSTWLDSTPVIEDPEQAKKAGELIKRGKIALDELDDERDGQVRPLNERVRTINDGYRVVSGPLDKIVREVKSRLGAYVWAEEVRRLAAAEAKHLEARNAAEALQRAQDAEREAIDDAAQGEVGADVGKAIRETAEALAEAAKAARAAAIAERDATVRVSTGLGKAISLRKVETLVVLDALAAVGAMLGNAKINDAILSAARDFRKFHDKLPPGVGAETERKL